MRNVNFIAIDFETATQKDACQLGIVIVEQGEIVDEKCFYIQPPENKYRKANILVHGIEPKDTENAPTFKELWPQIECYFTRRFIVGHNVRFDLDVLEHELEYYNINPPRFLGYECTCRLHDHMSLENACKFYDIKLEQHHDALADARASAEIFIEYLKGNGKFELGDFVPEKTERIEPQSIEIHEAIKGDLLIKDLSQADKDSPLYDKKIVITGVFPIERKDLAWLAKNKLGADINSSISKNTEIVLVGESAGPVKLKKIEELQKAGYNIKVYNVEETMNLVNKFIVE
jgi:DNA polymerase-3 subunit epsilon